MLTSKELENYVVGVKYKRYGKNVMLCYYCIETESKSYYNEVVKHEWFVPHEGAIVFDSLVKAQKILHNVVPKIFEENRSRFPKSVKLSDFRVFRLIRTYEEIEN